MPRSKDKFLHVSVFDLDYTLINANSSFEFCRYLHRKKVFPISYLFYSWKFYVQHKFFGMTLPELHQKVFDALLKGFSFKVLQEHVEEFVSKILENSIYYPAFFELRRAQHLGHYTMILSNSPSFIVKKIAERLGVNEWRASEYKIDKDGNLCQIASIFSGEEKAGRVKEVMLELNINKDCVRAYSDSSSDLPFLQSAGQVFVVNPDRKLYRESQRLNWQVL